MCFTDPETGVTSGLPEVAICVQGFDVQCVLQFTLVNAAGCALHRHTSRVIHRIEWSHVCHVQDVTLNCGRAFRLSTLPFRFANVFVLPFGRSLMRFIKPRGCKAFPDVDAEIGTHLLDESARSAPARKRSGRSHEARESLSRRNGTPNHC